MLNYKTPQFSDEPISYIEAGYRPTVKTVVITDPFILNDNRAR